MWSMADQPKPFSPPRRRVPAPAPVATAPSAAPLGTATPTPARQVVPPIVGVSNIQAINDLPTQEELAAAKRGSVPQVMIKAKQLSKSEREDYRKAGLDPDKLPDDAASRAALLAQALYSAPVPIPVPLTTPPLKVPDPVPYDQASPERQKAFREAVEAAKQFATPQPTPVAAPQQSFMPQPPIAREFSPPRMVLPPPIAEQPPAPPSPIAPPQQPPPPPPPLETAELGPDDQPPEHTPNHDPQCPKCGWDTRVKDLFVPTDEDLLTFQQCLYASRPFEKKMDLPLPDMWVKFRRLTVAEEKLAVQFVAREVKQNVDDKLAQSLFDVANMGYKYRMVMALTEWHNQMTYVTIPPLAERSISSGDPKDLNAALDDLTEGLFPSEDLFRYVQNAYYEFEQLCSRLWEVTAKPDFRKAIVTP